MVGQDRPRRASRRTTSSGTRICVRVTSSISRTSPTSRSGPRRSNGPRGAGSDSPGTFRSGASRGKHPSMSTTPGWPSASTTRPGSRSPQGSRSIGTTSTSVGTCRSRPGGSSSESTCRSSLRSRPSLRGSREGPRIRPTGGGVTVLVVDGGLRPDLWPPPRGTLAGKREHPSIVKEERRPAIRFGASSLNLPRLRSVLEANKTLMGPTRSRRLRAGEIHPSSNRTERTTPSSVVLTASSSAGNRIVK